MKRKLVFFLLALALCLSLTVPAMATGGYLFIMYPSEESNNYLDSASGEGWSYDKPSNTLTLNGANLDSIHMSRIPEGVKNPTLILAAGSVNTVAEFYVDSFEDGKAALTIKGTGKLIVQDNGKYSDAMETGVFSGQIESVTLQDGLTVTGGMSSGSSSPLTLTLKKYSWNDYTYRTYSLNSQSATYVCIAPAGSAAAPNVSSAGFSDVAAGSAFEQAIKWAVDQKITNGITATTFGPGNTCTVSHILTFLYRANKGPASGSERDAVISWAKSLGIDASNLSAPCTRAMAVSFMWKAAGSPAPSKTASFADVPANADYAKAVSWAVEKGVTNGTGGDAFSPGGTCTRGQIVTFLYRAAQ